MNSRVFRETSRTVSFKRNLKMKDVVYMPKKDTLTHEPFWFSNQEWNLEIKSNLFRELYLCLKRKSPLHDHRIFCSALFKYKNKVLQDESIVLEFNQDTDYQRISEIPIYELHEILQDELPSGIMEIECALRVPAPTAVNSRGTYQTSISPYSNVYYMSRNFEVAFLDESMTDILLVVGSTEIPAHKIIIAQSQVLKELVLRNGSSSTLVIKGCEPMDFKVVLWYFYTGKTDKVTSCNAKNIFDIAKKFKLEKLQKECLVLMYNSLTTENVCDALELCDMYGEKKLLEYATEFFIEHSNDIIRTEKWNKLGVKRKSVVEYCVAKLSEAHHRSKVSNVEDESDDDF